MNRYDKHDQSPAIIDVDDVLGGEFSMNLISEGDVTTATWATINRLSPTLDGADLATARLALEVAARIDEDGIEVGVSLYNRLHMLLQDLQHKERAYVCPYATQATQAAPTDPAE